MLGKIPFTETVNISAENRSYKKKVETETLENMCKLFQTLHVCQASTLDGLGLDEIFNANPKEQSSAEDRTAILQRWVNIEEDPEIVAAEEIRVFEEICAEFDNSITVSSTNENDQQSSSDISIILEDENVQVESEPAFNGVKALTQMVYLAMNIHSKAGKLDDPVLLDLAVRLHARASAKLQAAHCMPTP